MSFTPNMDARIGTPSLGIAEDHLLVVVRLIGFAARRVRRTLPRGSHENSISIRLLKKLILVQRLLGLENLEFHPEAILVDPGVDDEKMVGRIDLKVKFAHQFGKYDDYFAVECKRVDPLNSALLRYYVQTGVGKFANGTYGAGHPSGMIVGYLLNHPLNEVLAGLTARISSAHPEASSLVGWDDFHQTASILEGSLPRGEETQPIRLIHVFVDMTSPN